MWPVLNFPKCMPYITSSNSSTQELNHHWKLKKLKKKLIKGWKEGNNLIPSSEKELCTGAGAAGNLLRLRSWLYAVQRSQTKSKGIPVLSQRCPAVPGAGSASTYRELLCSEIPLPPASTCLHSAPARGSPLQKEQITAKKKSDLAKPVRLKRSCDAAKTWKDK